MISEGQSPARWQSGIPVGSFVFALQRQSQYFRAKRGHKRVNFPTDLGRCDEEMQRHKAQAREATA